MTIDQRYEKTIKYFEESMPIAETELIYHNPFELIVSVILSAQCTDKRVNMITKALFERFPDPISMSQSTVNEIFEYIKSCTYPNSKAKHLLGMSKMLVSDFNGTLPEDVAQLQKLPGVGRKTANVVASVLFDQPVMPVDTHVFRVAARIGLTENARTPLEAEKQLTANIPNSLIPKAHHWLILHGRYTCTARRPLCHDCGLRDHCKFFLQSNNNQD